MAPFTNCKHKIQETKAKLKFHIYHLGWSIVSVHHCKQSVATLTLGSQPKQRFARLRAKREAQESHLMFPGVKKSVREWTFTLPSELPFWEFESRWTPESSEGDCKGQNLLHWKVIYIIEKILKRKCLKWARMTHLDIWNTSYGQKKDQESNCQFDPDH
jgi:hypothetical protein